MAVPSGLSGMLCRPSQSDLKVVEVVNQIWVVYVTAGVISSSMISECGHGGPFTLKSVLTRSQDEMLPHEHKGQSMRYLHLSKLATKRPHSRQKFS